MVLPRTDLLRHLASDTRAIAAALPGADLDATVDGCPGWTLRDLVVHVGGIHRWAEAATRSDGPPSLDAEEPSDGDLPHWYDDVARSLVSRLTEADPDTPCWHFGEKPRVIGWWLRRQAHEAAVHHWDLRQALGRPEQPLDAALAADGVDEVLDVFLPRQLRLERIPALVGATRLRTTDTDTDTGTGMDRVLGEGPVGGTATGTASDLLLVLWHRRPLDVLAVDGDPGPLTTPGIVP